MTPTSADAAAIGHKAIQAALARRDDDHTQQAHLLTAIRERRPNRVSRLTERIDDTLVVTGELHTVNVIRSTDGIPSFELLDHRTNERFLIESPRSLVALLEVIERAASGYNDDDELEQDRRDMNARFDNDAWHDAQPKEHDDE